VLRTRSCYEQGYEREALLMLDDLSNLIGSRYHVPDRTSGRRAPPRLLDLLW
jgi:hypothetical protein